jgi:hypothetical protein
LSGSTGARKQRPAASCVRSETETLQCGLMRCDAMRCDAKGRQATTAARQQMQRVWGYDKRRAGEKAVRGTGRLFPGWRAGGLAGCRSLSLTPAASTILALCHAETRRGETLTGSAINSHNTAWTLTLPLPLDSVSLDLDLDLALNLDHRHGRLPPSLASTSIQGINPPSPSPPARSARVTERVAAIQCACCPPCPAPVFISPSATPHASCPFAASPCPLPAQSSPVHRSVPDGLALLGLRHPTPPATLAVASLTSLIYLHLTTPYSAGVPARPTSNLNETASPISAKFDKCAVRLLN